MKNRKGGKTARVTGPEGEAENEDHERSGRAPRGQNVPCVTCSVDRLYAMPLCSVGCCYDKDTQLQVPENQAGRELPVAAQQRRRLCQTLPVYFVLVSSG